MCTKFLCIGSLKLTPTNLFIVIIASLGLWTSIGLKGLKHYSCQYSIFVQHFENIYVFLYVEQTSEPQTFANLIYCSSVCYIISESPQPCIYRLHLHSLTKKSVLSLGNWTTGRLWQILTPHMYTTVIMKFHIKYLASFTLIFGLTSNCQIEPSQMHAGHVHRCSDVIFRKPTSIKWLITLAWPWVISLSVTSTNSQFFDTACFTPIISLILRRPLCRSCHLNQQFHRVYNGTYV